MLQEFGGVFLVVLAGRDHRVLLWRPGLVLFALDEPGGLLLVWGGAFALAELRLARLVSGRWGLLASTWLERRG